MKNFLSAIETNAPAAKEMVQSLFLAGQLSPSEIELRETDFVYRPLEGSGEMVVKLKDESVMNFYHGIVQNCHHFEGEARV